MASSYAIQLEGGDKLAALLDADKLLEKPVKDLLKAIGQQGKAAAKIGAPRGKTGGLSRSIGYRVSTKARWVSINSRDKRMIVTPGHGSSSLGRFLEFAKKYGHIGWLRTIVELEFGRLNNLLNNCADAIEARWKSGR